MERIEQADCEINALEMRLLGRSAFPENVDFGTAHSKFSGSCSSAILPLKIVVLLGPLDDRWWLDDVLSEDVSLDEVRKPHVQLVGDETFRWDREDLCERRQQDAR